MKIPCKGGKRPLTFSPLLLPAGLPIGNGQGKEGFSIDIPEWKPIGTQLE